jgi:hypothetical protein
MLHQNRNDNGKIFNITLLVCVMELDTAWHEISLRIISNYFKNTGILKMKGFEKNRKKIKIFHCLT